MIKLEKDLWRELKKLKLKLSGIDLKTVVYLVLPIYWAMLLVATFLH